MASDELGYKWWIRYVAIPLIGGGGLIGLWLALSSKPSQSPATDSTQIVSSKHEQSEPSRRADVERLVSQWLGAWLGGDTDGFVSLASVPFYFDQRVILTKPELRLAFDSLKQQKQTTWQKLQVIRIKVSTARELQAQGRDLSKDRIFGSLNLTLDDYAVEIVSRYEGRDEGLLVVVRRGPPLEIVGLWD